MASNYIKSFRSKTLPQALKLAYCQAKRLALQVYSTHDDKGKVRAQGRESWCVVARIPPRS